MARDDDALFADSTVLSARAIRSRAALLEAARRLFRDKGYAGTTIADITHEAGRALGSFYTYFANKEELLEELAEDFKQEIDLRMNDLDLTDADSYDVIRKLCAVYWISCRAHTAEFAAIFQASMVDEHFARRWHEIRKDARLNIAASIRAVDIGPAGLDPEATASALASMIDYFCYVWLVEGGDVGRKRLTDEAAIETLARILYRVIYAAPEHEPRRKGTRKRRRRRS